MDDIILCRKVDENVPKSRWIASLSNGETIFEDAIKGIAPTWERLTEYVIRNKLAITNLRAQLGHLEVVLPPHQDAYIEKKKLISTVGMTKRFLCIGYVQGDLCQIHQMSEDGDSVSTIGPDPGIPFTIYPHNKGPCTRACCAGKIGEGYQFQKEGEVYLVRRKDGENVFACRIDNGKPRRGRPRRFNIKEVLEAQ
jgi:hypothetical protein